MSTANVTQADEKVIKECCYYFGCDTGDCDDCDFREYSGARPRQFHGTNTCEEAMRVVKNPACMFFGGVKAASSDKCNPKVCLFVKQHGKKPPDYFGMPELDCRDVANLVYNQEY